MQNVIITHKERGETPYACLKRMRTLHNIPLDVPMTYAGRLDPMAEGVLIILVGDECRNKDAYTNLDKEYEVEILFGVATDTHDVLGLITDTKPNSIPTVTPTIYIGKFSQEYPAYSSKTVNGKALHQYAREGEIPPELPVRDVEIYTLTILSTWQKTREEVLQDVIERIQAVEGDFRQDDIMSRWKELPEGTYHGISVRVSCSSGTYMRSLAHRMGKDIGIPALAYSITRTRVAEYK